MHGHTYKVTVEIGGPMEDDMIADYAVIEGIVREFTDRLDHQVLNEIPGLENPTTESLVLWLVEKVSIELSAIEELRLISLEVDEGGHVARWTKSY